MKAIDLLRPEVATMEPYVPIYPPDVLAARLGRNPDDLIKLDANENPYGAPSTVRQALAEVRYAHIYPDPESRILRSALARYTGLPSEMLLAGAGSDELLDLITRAFLQADDALLDCPPTFSMYAFDAQLCGAQVVSVPRRRDFSLDLPAIDKAVSNHAPKLLCLASPNNPDGSLLPDADLAHLLTLPVAIVLDEAYIEFAGRSQSRIQWVKDHDNLIVLRTFSKWAGLAGLRAGYGAFPPDLVAHLWKIKQPYNVSVTAALAATIALDNRVDIDRQVDRIVVERSRLYQLLGAVPYLRPYPSQANFILCQVLDKDALAIKQGLEEEGILVRYFDKPRLRDHIRITVGRPDQSDALIAALRRL
jgi:histidinol-phosphate aminotransferase